MMNVYVVGTNCKSCFTVEHDLQEIYCTQIKLSQAHIITQCGEIPCDMHKLLFLAKSKGLHEKLFMFEMK